MGKTITGEYLRTYLFTGGRLHLLGAFSGDRFLHEDLRQVPFAMASAISDQSSLAVSSYTAGTVQTAPGTTPSESSSTSSSSAWSRRWKRRVVLPVHGPTDPFEVFESLLNAATASSTDAATDRCNGASTVGTNHVHRHQDHVVLNLTKHPPDIKEKRLATLVFLTPVQLMEYMGALLAPPAAGRQQPLSPARLQTSQVLVSTASRSSPLRRKRPESL